MSRRRNRIRAISVALPVASALIWGLTSSADSPPPLTILDPYSDTVDVDVDVDGDVNVNVAVVDSPTTFGDAHLLGSLDLSDAELVDGRYHVPLPRGRTAVLTLDPDVQRAAEKLLVEADAPYSAIVVMSIDGRLLALAGRSTEEPSRTHDLALTTWAPSASIFKIVTAAALVDAGVSPSTPVCYHGGLRGIDASHLRDDPRADIACESLSFALSHSQNAIIAKLAAKHLDAPSLTRTARLFGYGDQPPSFALAASPSRVDLPGDDTLELARAAAGFWHSDLSPLGGALLADTIASGGLRVTPRIVSHVIEVSGEARAILPAAPRRVLSEETALAVADMLADTTERGTARKGFRDAKGRPYLDVRVAGKTGSLSRKKPFLDYSWFVGFAPADEPRVVVSVLIGNSPSYRFKAHTVARLVLQATLRDVSDAD